ncbi:MAG: radical SAM protein [Candidatus Lokiarchaeota archaeon]|nr:radical SAM protein [Candidatus Lokiarchaeota archaeon]MBD3198392.1 radical SAM protein [Candidatus Lokiarchaeota archaeon]
MNLTSYPYVPKYIVIRKYKDYNIYDLKSDESYIIDDEAYELLDYSDGLTTVEQILDKFPIAKQNEIQEGLSQYLDLGILSLSEIPVEDRKDGNLESQLKTLEHQKVPFKNPFKMPYLKNLMINITERCNLTCKHCYITEKNKVDMPFEDLIDLIYEFYDLQGIRLILTGGEPLLYSKFKELLVELKTIPLEKVLLSNGTLILELDESILDLLKENYFEVFISLDGLEESHNDFRNSQCFNETVEGIKRLSERGIKVSINTMIHKENLTEFDEMYKLIDSIGEIKNWSIDIPTFDENTPKDIREKYEISYDEGGEVLKNYGWGVIYETPSEGEPFEYACGPYLMAVDVLGTITKCGFFYEQSVGNVFELGLEESWKRVQKDLNWSINDLKCKEIGCEFLEDCRGGCRYRALKDTGDIRGVDSYKCYQFGKLK